MSSVRLFAYQVERLKGLKCPYSHVLNTAIRRYRAKQIVIRNCNITKNNKNVLQLVAWRKRPTDLTDSQIREILDAHFAKPVNYSREIASLDKEIDAILSSYQGQQYYIIEED